MTGAGSRLEPGLDDRRHLLARHGRREHEVADVRPRAHRAGHEHDRPPADRDEPEVAPPSDIVAAEPPDCVLVDLIMPDTRGFALLGSLRSRHPRLPVLVVTADIQDQVRQQCLELGAFAVLHKPVDGEALRRTVAAALEAAP